VPSQVLVRFKQTAGAARTAVAQAREPVLAGLRLHRLVGKHHTIVVPHQQQGSSGRTLAQAAGPAPNLPSDALMLYDIEDGSSVEEMVARLCQHPGASATYHPRHTIDNRCSLLKPQRTLILVLLSDCVFVAAPQPASQSRVHPCVCSPSRPLSLHNQLCPCPCSPSLFAHIFSRIPYAFYIADIELVEPNFYATHHALLPSEFSTADSAGIPGDPMYFPGNSQQLSALWHLERIQAVKAWDFSTGNQQVSGSPVPFVSPAPNLPLLPPP
jgi:hypothetical protein